MINIECPSCKVDHRVKYNEEDTFEWQCAICMQRRTHIGVEVLPPVIEEVEVQEEIKEVNYGQEERNEDDEEF